MKNTNRAFKFLAALLLAGMFFLSCDFNKQEEYGTLIIRLPGSGPARAAVGVGEGISEKILPFLRYRIECNNRAYGTYGAGSIVPIQLKLTPGNYNVTIIALNDTGHEIGRGTESVDIAANEIKTISSMSIIINDITSCKIISDRFEFRIGNIKYGHEFSEEGIHITLYLPSAIYSSTSTNTKVTFNFTHTGAYVEIPEYLHELQGNEYALITVTAADGNNSYTYTVGVEEIEEPELPGGNGYLGQTLNLTGQVYEMKIITGNEPGLSFPPYSGNRMTVSALGGSGNISATEGLNFTIQTPNKLTNIRDIFSDLFVDDELDIIFFNNYNYVPSNTMAAVLHMKTDNNKIVSKQSFTSMLSIKENSSEMEIEEVSFHYVDKNVTVTANGVSSTTFIDNDNWRITSGHITLEMQQGWNAVHSKHKVNFNDLTWSVEVQVGNPALPWVLVDDFGGDFGWPEPNLWEPYNLSGLNQNNAVVTMVNDMLWPVTFIVTLEYNQAVYNDLVLQITALVGQPSYEGTWMIYDPSGMITITIIPDQTQGQIMIMCGKY